ncbi:MAG: YqeG family HAD IIIA-type phosphatase [Clostridia bacterium]
MKYTNYTQELKTKKTHLLKKIFKRFYPTYKFERVEDIPFELLEKEKIKLILFDMDNTLVNSEYIYRKSLKEWTYVIKEKNIKMCILSNSPMGKKVKRIARELGMKYSYNASKPSIKGFKSVVSELKLPCENVLMIGDQVFTDIWGGNRFGIKTVLVRPIQKKEWIFTKVKRPLEKMILKQYDKGKSEDDKR